MGAVSMKISRRTRTTSPGGMMLISDSEAPMRRPRSPPTGSRLKAIFRLPRGLRGRAVKEVQEVEAEPLHLDGPVLHAVHEEVIRDDGRDGGAEAGRRGDERFRAAGRPHGEAGRAPGADPPGPLPEAPRPGRTAR